MKYNLLKSKHLVTMLCIVMGASEVVALPTINPRKPSTERRSVMRTSAASCNLAVGATFLDINNVRAQIMTDGSMWYDRGSLVAAYEVPKRTGSNTGGSQNSLYAGSVWIGGVDEQNNLKVTAQTYRSSGTDYWPGVLNTVVNPAAPEPGDCVGWDYQWRVNKSDILLFQQLIGGGASAVEGAQFESIRTWPAKGNPDARGRNNAPLLEAIEGINDYAPFEDLNNNGTYEWAQGEYPQIKGDQYIWWVFNDNGNVKGQTQTASIFMEVQTSAFAFSTKDFLNDATFYNYRMINRGDLNLDSTFIATWTDADLGFAQDDYIGCDTARGLGILYNAKSPDGNGEATSYGDDIPMVGVDFFIGPTKKFINPITGEDSSAKLKMTVFNYFNNLSANPDPNLLDPEVGPEFYSYMTGRNKGGQPMHYDFQGAGISANCYGPGPDIKAAFPGNSLTDPQSFSECVCQNPAGDRRFIHSSGPFRLEKGAVYNDVTIGAIWVSSTGGCPNATFDKIFTADDIAQDLFDTDFQLLEGPEAPLLVKRELDRRVIFYLDNPPISNNFQEKFGYELDSAKYRRFSSKSKKFADSLYKFEGYRVFQLRDNTVGVADIYDEFGRVNTNNAAEVFTCDIRNGITTIVNHVKVPEAGENSYRPEVIINPTGRDQGIRHSFEITTDQFATGGDNRMVNYKTYYFVAVAYSYNNFATFDPLNEPITQDRQYLESGKGPGGIPIEIVEAMPHTQHELVESMINSNYGDGVAIKRLEGIGNGGLDIQIDNETENSIMTSDGKIVANYQPVYLPGKGPVSVKVIDPVRVQAKDWELIITGVDSSAADSTLGVAASTAQWRLTSTDGSVSITGDRNLTRNNEQILAAYGIAIDMKQVMRAGDENNREANGYITSEVRFADNNVKWLTGTNDKDGRDINNWILSGQYFVNPDDEVNPPYCTYDDIQRGGQYIDSFQHFERFFSTETEMTGTWAPFALGMQGANTYCGASVAPSTNLAVRRVPLSSLHSVDLVFTSDKSKWTRALVVETQDTVAFAEGQAPKFSPRSHQSWVESMDLNADGAPVYSTADLDTAMSWFPGYAIDQETGERLNIVFGEDSYLKSHNGADLIWNPTSTMYSNTFGNVIWGGKHFVYVLGSKYDSCKSFLQDFGKLSLTSVNDWETARYVGVPTVQEGFALRSLQDGLIPTETRLRFRVTRPYGQYMLPEAPAGYVYTNDGYPKYSFSTTGLVKDVYASGNQNWADSLLKNIYAVPNPYYAYSGYEQSRLDTRIKIINLPKAATISIYSLDGTLVRRLKKDTEDDPQIVWDLRNERGLQIASGMYLIHVNVPGYGEKVISWFGGLRPVDALRF